MISAVDFARAGALAASALALTLVTQTPGRAEPGAHTMYVDGRLQVAACTTYDAARRSCSGGRDAAVRSLTDAAARAAAGTTVFIREGVYSDPLRPANSGTAERPVVFKAFEHETATLSNIDAPAIQIINLEHVIVEGLTVEDTIGWGRLENARSSEIRRMTFRRAGAHGTTGGLKIVRSSLNRITDNRFDEGNDSVMIQDASNGNVVANNVFTNARHTLLCIKCSNVNVIRGNVFSNAIQKAMEIFDCEGGSDAPFRLDATKRNLVEDNVFLVTKGSGQPHDYNAIQHGGQYTIVRRNAFVQDLGGGVAYQSYESESLFVYGNRLYHNTFYGNRCFALIGYTGDSKRYRDNRAVNNLFYKNSDCQGRGDQISLADPRAVIASSNAIETRDPLFADEARRDFHLSAASPMVDRAGALTTTREAGQGTMVPVIDPVWFFDGFTIPNESGDEIQLLGTTDVARILSIDYNAGTLTIDRPLRWRGGQGIALKYVGLAPDFGAAEFEPRASGDTLPEQLRGTTRPPR
jgi:hypothetical protein